MLWGPDHWDAWVLDEPPQVPPGSAKAILQSALSRLPRPQRTSVAELACRDGGQSRFLAHRFGSLTVIDPRPEHLFRARGSCREPGIRFRCRDLLQLGRLPEKYHLAVATGEYPWSMSCDADRILEQVRHSLREGGVLAAMFPATTAGDGPVILAGSPVRERSRGYHEVELQYRLRRAGFQGVRIRRAVEEGSPVLLALAVRRGFN